MNLKVIAYKKGNFNYQLDEGDHSVQLPGNYASPGNWEEGNDFVWISTDGILHISEGYAWDGLTGIPDKKSWMIPGLEHDALYQLMREGKLNENIWKLIADEFFYTQLLKYGAWKITAKILYRGVRCLGISASDPKKVRKLLKAP